jgi:hypothetical protein
MTGHLVAHLFGRNSVPRQCLRTQQELKRKIFGRQATKYLLPAVKTLRVIACVDEPNRLCGWEP